MLLSQACMKIVCQLNLGSLKMVTLNCSILFHFLNMSLWQGLLTSGLFLHPIKVMTSLPSLLSALRNTRGAYKNKSNQDACGGDDCYNLLEGRQINLHTNVDTSNLWRFTPNEVNEAINHARVVILSTFGGTTYFLAVNKCFHFNRFPTMLSNRINSEFCNHV